MDACPRYLCTCVYAIVCMSARKKAPVNLLMCPFELYMFIGVSMQLRVVFKYDFLVLIPYCWSVAFDKKINKLINGCGQVMANTLTASNLQMSLKRGGGSSY